MFTVHFNVQHYGFHFECYDFIDIVIYTIFHKDNLYDLNNNCFAFQRKYQCLLRMFDLVLFIVHRNIALRWMQEQGHFRLLSSWASSCCRISISLAMMCSRSWRNWQSLERSLSSKFLVQTYAPCRIWKIPCLLPIMMSWKRHTSLNFSLDNIVSKFKQRFADM